MSKFFYKGVIYDSFEKGCESAGVSRSLAYTTLRRHKCSKQEALDIAKAGVLRKDFVYKGDCYKTMQAYCSKHGVSSGTIYKIMSAHKCSGSDALDIWYKTIAPKKLLHKAANCYMSKVETAALYGVSYSNARKQSPAKLQEYIDSSIEQGLILPDKVGWIEQGWVIDQEPMFSLKVLRPSDVFFFKDAKGNKMFRFRDVYKTSIEVQFQQVGLWLIRAYPEITADEAELVECNKQSCYGTWAIDEVGRVRLQYMHRGWEKTFKTVLQILSAMSRACVAAPQIMASIL